MYKKITKPQLKKMLREAGGEIVEISLCQKGKDINHPFLCAHMEVRLRAYEELQVIIETSWRKFHGTKEEPQLCIWVDEEGLQ